MLGRRSPCSRAISTCSVSMAYAASAILAGVAGMVVSYNMEKRGLAVEPQLPRPRMYRQKSCQVTLELVDHARQALNTLEKLLKDRHWEFSPDAAQEHRELAEKA